MAYIKPRTKIERATASDKNTSNPNLCKVYAYPENEDYVTLVACDERILAINQNVEGKLDESVHIPSAIFTGRRKDATITIVYTFEDSGENVFTFKNSEGKFLEDTDLDAVYPDVTQVLPPIEEHIKVGIDATLLLELALALTEKDARYPGRVILHIPNPNSEGYVYRPIPVINASGYHHNIGVIMPLKPAPDSEQTYAELRKKFLANYPKPKDR